MSQRQGLDPSPTNHESSEKQHASATAGRMAVLVKSARGWDAMSFMRGINPDLFERLAELRIRDIQEQMMNNKDHAVHLELVGRVLQLKELVAAIKYARM